MKTMMRTRAVGMFLGAMLAGGGGLGAAEWSYSADQGNALSAVGSEAQPALALIGAETGSPWKWRSADGIQFLSGADGTLHTAKIIGETATFTMRFQFQRPVTKFRFTTPAMTGLDFSRGGCRFSYSWLDQPFQPLAELTAPASDPIPARPGEWVTLPSDVRVKELTIRLELDGYVGDMNWSTAALEYVSGTTDIDPVTGAEVTLCEVEFLPAGSTQGFTYAIDRLPQVRTEATVDRVRMSDVNVPSAVRELAVTAGEVTLPPSEPGMYNLDFYIGAQKVKTQRIALVKPARELTLEQMKRSPFGLVGITRTQGFRESTVLNGPAIGRLLGIHQERGGLPAWCEVGLEGPGKYAFGATVEELDQRIRDTGILLRQNLAWSPGWAVDPARVPAGEWSGHFPPKPEFLKDYAEFCRLSAARRSDFIVNEFEMWNEPNNEPYGSFKGTFEEFVEMNRVAAVAVHSVDPTAKMILGTTGDPDVGYIARLLKAGLSEHFAIVDIHPYRHTNQGPEDGLLGDINRLKRAIAEYGDDQEMIFTEVGWPTTAVDTPGYQKVDEFEQACFNSRTLLISLAGGVSRIHFHMLEDWGRDPNNPEFHFGFFRLDGSPKLTVGAFNTTARHLEQSSFLGRLPLAEYEHAWYWETPWRPDAVLVTVWADTQRLPNPGQIVIPGILLDAETLWGATPGRDRVSQDGAGIRVLPGADPLFLYVERRNLPELEPLPLDLRQNLIQRVSAPLIAAGRDPEKTFMVGANESKAMGFAGIGDNAPRQNERVDLSKTSEASNFTCSYDAEGLLIDVEVKSGQPMRNEQRGWWLWAGDCIRLYIGQGDEPYMTATHYQICVAPTTADGKPDAVLISYDAASGYNAGDSIPAAITAENTDYGWRLAVKLPWSFFGGRPEPRTVWKFDITVPGAVWNSAVDDRWNNPLHWGELEFI